jgi:hypothetical protein
MHSSRQIRLKAQRLRSRCVTHDRRPIRMRLLRRTDRLAGVDHHAYRVGVGDDIVVIGDDPLADGMNISVRYRRDFVITDAARLLEAARSVFCELNPEASPDDAAAAVTCAADAIFSILERDGLIGDATDARLAGREADGIEVLGWRAQVTVNEPEPLRPGRDCLRTGDVFALPTAAPDDDAASQRGGK